MPKKGNIQFQEAVRTAYFNLSLARTHIHGLALVGWGIDEVPWPHFVTVMGVLRRKGLVEHKDGAGFPERIKQVGRSAVMAHYRLTRAGELTFQLLIEADMITAKPPKKMVDDLKAYRKQFFHDGDYKYAGVQR